MGPVSVAEMQEDAVMMGAVGAAMMEMDVCHAAVLIMGIQQMARIIILIVLLCNGKLYPSFLAFTILFLITEARTQWPMRILHSRLE